MASKVFVVGPGYVGREIIDLLRAESKYEITTLVRRVEAAHELKKDGINAVLGDLNDSKLIQDLTSQNDIVFHTATADHLASAQAILNGIEHRASQGKRAIYLHQSGASVLSDASPGNNPNNEIYSDANPNQINTLKDDAPHRKIDLTILEARKKLGDKARITIWMPPIIYGNTKHKRLSIQIPALTRFALKHGHAGYLRSGKETWATIHVLDLAKAYVRVLHWLETAPDEDQGLENPYFFCENGEITWGDIASMIGKGLYDAGRINTAETKAIPESDYKDLFGEFTPDVVGCNCRNQAERLRSMGWKPEQLSLKDAFEKEDLPVLLEETGEFKASAMTLS